MTESVLQKIKAYDASRTGIPGEHWLAAAAGVGAWLATRRHPSIAVRLLGSIAGTLLIARSVSGRDVPLRLARWLPFENERDHR